MVRQWEIGLKISGNVSDYKSVTRLLAHLLRKSGSEASKELYCYNLFRFYLFVGKRKGTTLSPDDIVRLSKQEVESLVQSFCDLKVDSRNCANMQLHVLKTFFKINGFKGDRELDLESYSLRGFVRIRPEYIPTLAEALKMADVAGNLKNRAIILVLFSTGLRVSTLCAILYSDIKNELERGTDMLQVRVYSEMKKIVPNACKGRIEYTTFTSPEATEAIRLYLKERARKYGEIGDKEPLFIPEVGRLRRIKRSIRPLTSREVQLIVKAAARKAGLENWKNVTPHALRKTFSSWVLRTTLRDGGTLEAKTQEVLMGHRLPGSQDVYYDRTKPEELRKEYSRLNFTPRIEGRLEPSEILKIMSDALGIDFLQMLSSKKMSLNRDLTSGEQLHLIKEALQKGINEFKATKYLEEKQQSTNELTKLTENIKLQPFSQEQTFLFSRFSQQTEPCDKKDYGQMSKLSLKVKKYNEPKNVCQSNILSFSCDSQ
ncbi:tyrosine-type recombinase/integrase [Candidatus Bathyarchaeota archaeon]|nr:tyrosine-type recombinase/integrase [Candidatus Bathyarchaeota archaeon]